MDLELLQLFLTIAEQGSLLNAAKAMGRSRTTLRHKLAQLEQQAGVKFWQRSEGGLTLTPAGRLLLERGRTLMAEATSLLSWMRDAKPAPKGTLRVALPLGFPPHAFCTLAGLSLPRFSQWKLELHYTSDPITLLRSDADMAVHFADETPPGPWLSLQVWPLRARLVASAAYLSLHGAPECPEDLTAHRLLVWNEKGIDPRKLPLLAGGVVPVRASIVSDQSHFLRCLAADGQGIAWLPDGGLSDPLNPDLQPVLQDAVGARLGIRIVVPWGMLGTLPIDELTKLIAQFLRREEKLASE